MPNIEGNQKKWDYKSPTLKLVKFFRNSRDKWKSKYMETRYRAKRLSGQIRYWKEKNAELKLRIKELEEQIESAPKKTGSKSDTRREIQRFSRLSQIFVRPYLSVYSDCSCCKHKYEGNGSGFSSFFCPSSNWKSKFRAGPPDGCGY